MPLRSRKTELSYRKFRAQLSQSDCPFCHLDTGGNKLVTQASNFVVIENRFPYDIWDDLRVQEHLMLIPKRHIDRVSEFNSAEAAEFTKMIGQYTERGYSVYARSHANTAKSVDHQHTHLLKLDDRNLTATLWIENPYILMYH